MRLTQFTDFSLRLLMYLARHPDRAVPMREVATFYGISVDHLKKIVHRLAELGHVRTLRGKNGGLMLARDPAAINLGRLVKDEENLCLLPCHDAKGGGCPLDDCRLAGVVDEALAAFLAVLDRRTLADLT